MWWKSKATSMAPRRAQEASLRALVESKERRRQAEEVAAESKLLREANHFSERLAMVITSKNQKGW